MKKVIKMVFILVSFFSFVLPVKAEKEISLYFFHGRDCPHCDYENKFLEERWKSYPNLKIVKYEVWYNEENNKLLNKVKNYFEVQNEGVPFTVIGNTYFVGYDDDMSYTIKRAFNYYQENDYVDIVSGILNGSILEDDEKEIDYFMEQEAKSDQKLTILNSIFGKINLKRADVSSAAIITGLLEGFSPSIIWLLLFFMCVLIGVKSKKKMIIYGITFFISSILFYLSILFFGINASLREISLILVRSIIVLFILGFVLFSFYNFLKKKNDFFLKFFDSSVGKFFKKIKKFIQGKSFVLGLVFALILAFYVNLVEVDYSFGVMFRELLTINNIGRFFSFLYFILHIISFLLDELIVFLVSLFTVKVVSN